MTDELELARWEDDGGWCPPPSADLDPLDVLGSIVVLGVLTALLRGRAAELIRAITGR